MRRPVLSRLIAVLIAGSSTGCISVTTPVFMQSAPRREWQPTLDRARDFARNGQTRQADSLLEAYAVSYPRSAQAIETNYWRSLIQLQAPATSPGVLAAIPLLRAYLAAGPTEHHLEAEALLRAAARVDTLSRAAESMSTKVVASSGEAVTANARAADAKADVKAVTADQDAEIRRLKDELAKSRDELDRIKKRLAEPTKKPPRW